MLGKVLVYTRSSLHPFGRPRPLLLASLLCLGACQGFADQGQPVLNALGHERQIDIMELAPSDWAGLSDLTHTENSDDDLTFWAIPEQQRSLLQLNLSRSSHPFIEREVRPIVGIDEAYDTESVTALGDGQFAIGTETMRSKRPSDLIFIVAGDNPQNRDRGPLKVVDTITMPYALWPGVLGRRNEGLEALCAAGDTLIAGSETVGKLATGVRFAPLGAYNRQTRSWTPYALSLTLATGRLSAVQCRISQDDRDHMELVAIERHYGVTRVLRALLPLQPAVEGCQEPQVIHPEVVADLGAMMTPVVNFEGIDWLPSGDLLLITDNHMGFVRGPTYFLRLPKL